MTTDTAILEARTAAIFRGRWWDGRFRLSHPKQGFNSQMKAGVQNVQPPVVILENMLAVCVHLDDCHERNGALRVLPGTHCSGRLTAEQVELAQQAGSTVTCSVGHGGAVLLKPLTLHASSAAVEPSHRRVIHIDYAACPLPSGLAWFAGPNRHLYNSPK